METLFRSQYVRESAFVSGFLKNQRPEFRTNIARGRFQNRNSTIYDIVMNTGRNAWKKRILETNVTKIIHAAWPNTLYTHVRR